MTDAPVPPTTPLVIGAVPGVLDIEWLCLHPKHRLAMVQIEGKFYPMIVDENGDGPVVPHTDDMNDAAWRGIEEDMEAGRCWACRCEAETPHDVGCPEAAQ